MRTPTLKAFVLLVGAVQAAFACSLVPMKLRQVASELTIVVMHREKPIAGIKVLVIPENSNEPVFSGSTDVNGAVSIDGLPVGRYYLTASHEDFEAGKEWIEVVAFADAKMERRFNFDWADWSYPTGVVEGTLTGLVPGNTGNKLMDIVHPQETVYAGVDITLKSAFSNDEFRTVSDGTGAFVFADVPEGIYILTIAGGMKFINGTADVTRQVLDVARSNNRQSLPLQLTATGCYRNEFQLVDR